MRIARFRPRALARTAGIGCVFTLAASLSGAQEASPGAQFIKYRQAMYTVMGANFGQIAAMAQGKAPFDAKNMAVRADRVAFISKMLPEGFPPASKEGAPTKAKAQIWENQADFNKLMQNLQAKTDELAKVAKTNDLAKIRPAVAETGQACKSCHDKYKTD